LIGAEAENRFRPFSFPACFCICTAASFAAMKHAGAAALDRIVPLLDLLRTRTALKEKTRGVFYCGGRAFLHFHEDGAEIFADFRPEQDFMRLPVTTPAQQTALLRKIDMVLRKD
jgi:hypothetical protein